MSKNYQTIDANTAVAKVAYAFSEIAIIFPITPASPIGAIVEQMSVKGQKNIFYQTVKVMEMQSEAGASGAVHWALTTGSIATTFTASQWLLLMLPNMFKIAGEMLPTVFHVASRSLAYQSLSIFGDHSDVMTARGTGFALLSSSSVQESFDMAIVAHLATMKSSVPFIHFFDGFRTSHEIQKIEILEQNELAKMVDQEAINKFKARALNNSKPMAKVGAQNPDVYFQGRETVNLYYEQLPSIVEEYLAVIKEKTGRDYQLFEYYGSQEAEKVIIAMGSSIETIKETIDYLKKKGEKLGVINVRLFRPFSVSHFLSSLPKTVQKIAVLDRTKEAGSQGDPLYLDIVVALKWKDLKIVGGRYGLSSKEFTPSMVKAVYDNLDEENHDNFTVGILDNLTYTSLPLREQINTENEDVVSCKFWWLGSDGTVGASKNTIKIIGNQTKQKVQAYFSYDSKKSGGLTRSFLRFSMQPIRSTYLSQDFDIISVNNPTYLTKYDVLEGIKEGGIFLINTPLKQEYFWHNLPVNLQEVISKKKLQVYTIDADKIALDNWLAGRINIVMQGAFFKISQIIEWAQAKKLIAQDIANIYADKGEEVIQNNIHCLAEVDTNLEKIITKELKIIENNIRFKTIDTEGLSVEKKEFVTNIIEPILKLKGDQISVKEMPLDGQIPTGTSALEKRGVADFVPQWIPEKCIQCGLCAFNCPHASIRIKQMTSADLKNKPDWFEVIKSNNPKTADLYFRVQVYPQDCTGCSLCQQACPTGALKMIPFQEAMANKEDLKAKFFNQLPENNTGVIKNTIKDSQLKTPLFEFSGACSGCGETPYIKLVTQLFGKKMLIANATGCSSIYGGTFPTIPYTTNAKGQGPAWANSLFEDNAEYGFGFRLSVNYQRKKLKSLLEKVDRKRITSDLRLSFENILKVWDKNSQTKETDKLVEEIIDLINQELNPEKTEEKGFLTNDLTKSLLNDILNLADYFIDKSIWAIGGDGWAYDIGFGGLDHVLAQKEDINILVLDNELYANTGGQASKSSPLGSINQFTASGKETAKKNLGLMMMAYGSVYVASICLGANHIQTLKAIIEAEKYPGPSIIIAYSPCINHGVNLKKSLDVAKKAVNSGYWPLYRYNPLLKKEGKNPLIIDGPKEFKEDLKNYWQSETRFSNLKKFFPKRAEELFAQAEKSLQARQEKLK